MLFIFNYSCINRNFQYRLAFPLCIYSQAVANRGIFLQALQRCSDCISCAKLGGRTHRKVHEF